MLNFEEWSLNEQVEVAKSKFDKMSGDPDTKFGIIMVTYQRGDGKTPEYIKEAIDSVKSQKHKNWKIYLIGDDYDDNDEKLLEDFFKQGTTMLEKAGCTNIGTYDSKQAPGLDIHEMGGVRMGRDPKTSLLNEWNQMHLCQNVFVTDGAAMTSTSTQNPSLTFMALTARAANYAVEQIKNGKL